MEGKFLDIKVKFGLEINFDFFFSINVLRVVIGVFCFLVLLVKWFLCSLFLYFLGVWVSL